MSIIKEKKLTTNEVLQIVSEWYCSPKCPDIFQSERGTDLEEYCEIYIDNDEVLQAMNKIMVKQMAKVYSEFGFDPEDIDVVLKQVKETISKNYYQNKVNE